MISIRSRQLKLPAISGSTPHIQSVKSAWLPQPASVAKAGISTGIRNTLRNMILAVMPIREFLKFEAMQLAVPWLAIRVGICVFGADRVLSPHTIGNDARKRTRRLWPRP